MGDWWTGYPPTDEASHNYKGGYCNVKSRKMGFYGEYSVCI